MPQHINLLQKQPLLPPSLLWGGLGILLVVAGQVAYGAWLWRANAQQSALEAQETAELAVLRARLALRGQQSTDETQLQADMERLTPQASAYAPLLNRVQQGGLGLPTGYLDHLTLLARTTDPQVWITQVSLGSAGRHFSLQGQAVDETAVLNYRDRINQAYAVLGLGFVSMDLSVTPAGEPATDTAPGAPPAPESAPKTVSFRLN